MPDVIVYDAPTGLDHTINVPLLRKELEWATAELRRSVTDGVEPEWHQASWIWTRTAKQPMETACGTSCCIAGRTVLDTGHQVAWYESRVDGGWVAAATVDGRTVSDVAAEELGLNRYQAQLLFSAYRSLRQLWRLAAGFTYGEITVPDDLPPGADLLSDGTRPHDCHEADIAAALSGRE